MNKAENETKSDTTKEEVEPAIITIEFSIPNEDGEVSTNVEAKNMSIQHFKHLKAVAQWYIENEFPQEEQDKLVGLSADKIDEK